MWLYLVCGGVGSYSAEALVRSGIGNITLIDNDIVDITNINRQLIADTTTVGKSKIEVAKERLLKINPIINVKTYKLFYDESKWVGTGDYAKAGFGWLGPVVKVIDAMFWPVLIIVAAAGAIWVIVLAVNLARAETADKASEAKKRLINVVIALVSVVVLVVALAFFVSYLPEIFDAAKNQQLISGGATT